MRHWTDYIMWLGLGLFGLMMLAFFIGFVYTFYQAIFGEETELDREFNYCFNNAARLNIEELRECDVLCNNYGIGITHKNYCHNKFRNHILALIGREVEE